MKKKLICISLISSLIIPLISCQQENINSTNLVKKSEKTIDYTLRGISDFSPSKFNVKAGLATVAAFATVSIVNTGDHSTDPYKTVATGLTDTNGNFAINPGFTPSNGDIFILDSIKRIGSGGKDLISISTFIQWDSTQEVWKSMTTPNLYINTKTTALALIADNQSNEITPAQTIQTIDVSSGSSVPSDIGTITATHINTVADLVTTVINNDADPIRYIQYNYFYNQYFIDNPDIINN